MMFRPCLLLLCVAVTWALDCKPLGMEDRTIPDASLSASSEINKWHGAKEGRLNNVKSSAGVGAWCANKKDNVTHRYIQIDLGKVHKICKIATQGRNTKYDQYVKNYRIFKSKQGIIYTGIFDKVTLEEIKFIGNTDKNSIVLNDLPSIEARYIRVIPMEFKGQICMRIELCECEAPVTTPAPVVTTPAPDTSVPATTQAPTQPPVVCPDGYRVGADNKTCEDINECTDQTAKCNQFCHNTNGSYVCSCKQGFRLGSDKHTCEDINECDEKTDGCEQLCFNNDGSFTCGCNSGYRLKSDNKGCEDIDECAEKTDKCDKSTTSCKNSIGSYSCPCLSGYEITSDRHKCKDIDECKTGAHQCKLDSTTCVNSPGNYSCKCRPGYEPDTRFQCKDINECLTNNGGCSDGCQNLNGNYICTCPDGYELDSTNKNCVDKDECKLANGGCQHICTNNDGSFKCSCRSGYQLNPDGFTCSDINECKDGSSQCDPTSTDCNNFSPGYECKCKDGYVPISGNNKKCEAKTCFSLIEPPGTSVSPSTCLQDKGSVVGDLCKFSCKAGYELPSNEDTLLCLATGSWNASVINCKRVSCPKLAVPANGKIDPASCVTQGNVYLEKCIYSCNSGFEISGVAEKTCRSDGQWDSQGVPTCTQLFPDPWITCPDNVVVTLSPGANKADVSALLQDPKSNQPPSRITITPGQYLADKMFPAGTTILTYVATNPNGKTKQCQTTVIVQDKEKPKVSGCPSHIYETTKDNNKAISWTEPTFKDNVAVTKVSSVKKPGDVFDLGSTNVRYTAEDAAKNIGTCSFTVNLKKLECPTPTPPDNGKAVVTPGFPYLTIQCNLNKKMFKNAYFVQCVNLVWGEIPDCVDYMDPNSDGSCPESYVKQGSLNSAPPENICVKCPRGYFYDVASKTCKKCAVGSISKQEGSLQCESCPAKSSTLVEGSKVCTAQCYAGQFSNSGFDLPADLEPCEPCPEDSYQNQIGQKGCEKCPNGTGTITNGATSSNDCGGPPMISSFTPNPTNATENKNTQFECYGNGIPLPRFSIKKVKTEGFLGKYTQEAITGPNGNQIGIRHIITGVKEHDAGAFECMVDNKFGTDQRYLTVNVELDFSIGKRRRRQSGL